MLFYIWVIFHVLTCVALILVVLMQSAKGEGLAGGTAFGGGMSGAVFGGRGAASFLSKATTVLAILFMVNCGALAFMSADTRNIATSSGAATTGTESAVTRKAQAEREAAMERQAQQAEAARQDSLLQFDDTSAGIIDAVPSGGESPTGNTETPAEGTE